MGALNPLFLLAGLAVGVPLFLHLFHKHRAKRVVFPALRYLQRTEREHAREIRFRQLLLLLLRVAILILVVLAGARFFIQIGGSEHPPTAVVVILDNSASSSRVVGDRRVLDELKEVALSGVAASGPDDRFWVLRAGEPWAAAVPGGAEEASGLIRTTEISAAAGDLSAALHRAQELLATTSLSHAEIHLVSDLQASAFPEEASPVETGVEVVAWDPWTGSPGAGNRALVEVEIGGGLPPLVGQRTQVAVRGVAGSDSAEIPVRLLMDDRIRGAATVPAGGQATIPLPPVSEGWVQGWVEADPDALRLDDRRYFSFRARPAPSIQAAGDPGPFVVEALSVLQEAGRLSGPGSAATPDLVLSAGGSGLSTLAAGSAVLVLPPADPALIPALNRQLAAAEIPWRFGPLEDRGSVPLSGPDLPDALSDVTVARWYPLSMQGDPTTPPRTLARTGSGAWAVEGARPDGLRYLLLGSPLDAASSTLPVSSQMVRFLDWVSGVWAAPGGGPVEYEAGAVLSAPAGAELVRHPDGTLLPVDGTRSVRSTDQVGFYTFLDRDTMVVSVRAVNPAPSESHLEALPRSDWGRRIGGTITPVEEPARWDRTVFRVRQGPELWFPLLAAALLLLLAESLVAAGARPSSRSTTRTPAPTHGTS